MKYKVGDRVRIKDDLSNCKWADDAETLECMSKYQGHVVVIENVCEEDGRYMVFENNLIWDDDTIEGPAGPELTNVEVLRLAIETYGEDEQIRVCQEEMNELGVAFSKYHRNQDCSTKSDVLEEIADVCVMMQQMKMIFGEKDVDKIILGKTERLKKRLEDEREVEVEIVQGKYSVNGATSTWANPNDLPVKIGHIAMVEDEEDESGSAIVPIIVTHTGIEEVKVGELKDFKTIVEGCVK